jgi:hypothetical protein
MVFSGQFLDMDDITKTGKNDSFLLEESQVLPPPS